MNIKNIIINLVLICVLFINLNAELLILKQTISGFEPLSQADIDKDGDAISKIILKYQWPMCIISKLSKEEQEEIGSSLTNSEEIFIEKKLREISDDYRVVFIPTVLYELFFLLCDIEEPTVKDSIKKICQLISDYTLRFNDFAVTYSINSYKSETNKKPLPEQLNDIYSWYKIFNNNFFDLVYLNSKKPNSMPDFNITPYMLLNQKIIEFLFSSGCVYQLEKSKTSLDFSNVIEQGSTSLLFSEIQNKFNKVREYNNSMAGKSVYITEILTKITDFTTGKIKITESLKRMIVLEYEARKLNRGILIRGTNPISVDIEVENAQQDTTVPAKTIFKKIQSKITAMATSFHSSGLYSISFGNSMFAGIFDDVTACTYSYLSNPKIFGYSVFIDKKKYFNHKLFNLFFISPLSTIAGMLASGEFFHSRTKVPGANKSLLSKYNSYSIKGVYVYTALKTINGIILINQKILDYEKVFSKFIAENGRIIQIGESGFGVGSGLVSYEAVLQAQEEKFKESQILLARSSAAKIVQTEDFKKKQLGIVVGKFIKKLREKRDENQKNLINLTTSLAVLRWF